MFLQYAGTGWGFLCPFCAANHISTKDFCCGNEEQIIVVAITTRNWSLSAPYGPLFMEYLYADMNKTYSKDGTAIAYKKSGAGPAVILIDGAFCSSGFGPMPKLAPMLEKYFTVITYDRRAR